MKPLPINNEPLPIEVDKELIADAEPSRKLTFVEIIDELTQLLGCQDDALLNEDEERWKWADERIRELVSTDLPNKLDALDYVRRLKQSAIEARKDLIESLEAENDRDKSHIAKMNNAVAYGIAKLNLDPPSLRGNMATFTLCDGLDRLHIVDEDALPLDYCRSVWVPNNEQIKSDLQKNIPVTGACLIKGNDYIRITPHKKRAKKPKIDKPEPDQIEDDGRGL